MTRRPAEPRGPLQSFQLRWTVACVGVVLLGMTLVGRAVHLQVFNKEFLIGQAAARHIRTMKISANRGVITDRNGEPLAASMPVDSLWVSPQELAQAPESIPELAKALGLDRAALARQVTRNVEKDFMYLQRHMNPADARVILDRRITGRARVAGVPPLLPGRRGGRPRHRLHERGRRRPGRHGARVRRVAARARGQEDGAARPAGARDRRRRAA